MQRYTKNTYVFSPRGSHSLQTVKGADTPPPSCVFGGGGNSSCENDARHNPGFQVSLTRQRRHQGRRNKTSPSRASSDPAGQCCSGGGYPRWPKGTAECYSIEALETLSAEGTTQSRGPELDTTPAFRTWRGDTERVNNASSARLSPDSAPWNFAIQEPKYRHFLSLMDLWTGARHEVGHLSGLSCPAAVSMAHGRRQ